jgi:hypothetical protein
MDALIPQHFFWTFAAVQFGGLLSAAVARFGENRLGSGLFQFLFLVALVVVALVTMFAIFSGWASWVISGATLSIMVVLAVWDPGVQAVR